ncbi:hypothetical protein SteCoe_31257 [Stentor coeruleus]|uniref:Uncharacterized protein n=1 Tax=Stentor coeruleus TaxID=5963 RepID=A0A1R2B1S4_9CILI|nr:hypothetical protein SteCoe_31257 [Stentor coeruleus]
MEKLRVLEMKQQQLRQERLKLERKAKMREAQDIQSNVLHTRTLESELKVIEKQKEAARARNEKILIDMVSKVNDLNENISRNSLKRSKDRLVSAKCQFYDVITSEYPDWTDHLKDPESFKARKIQENLEKLRNLQAKKQEDYRKQMEAELEIIKYNEQYMNELYQEKEMARLREKSKQDFMIKAEQERMNLRSRLEAKREEDLEKQIILFAEAQNEVFNENNRKISTPTTHIPNSFNINRNKEEEKMKSGTQEGYENQYRGFRENFQNVQGFPIGKKDSLDASSILPESKNISQELSPKYDVRPRAPDIDHKSDPIDDYRESGQKGPDLRYTPPEFPKKSPENRFVQPEFTQKTPENNNVPEIKQKHTDIRVEPPQFIKASDRKTSPPDRKISPPDYSQKPPETNIPPSQYIQNIPIIKPSPSESMQKPPEIPQKAKEYKPKVPDTNFNALHDKNMDEDIDFGVEVARKNPENYNKETNIRKNPPEMPKKNEEKQKNVEPGFVVEPKKTEVNKPGVEGKGSSQYLYKLSEEDDYDEPVVVKKATTSNIKKPTEKIIEVSEEDDTFDIIKEVPKNVSKQQEVTKNPVKKFENPKLDVKKAKPDFHKNESSKESNDSEFKFDNIELPDNTVSVPKAQSKKPDNSKPVEKTSAAKSASTKPRVEEKKGQFQITNDFDAEFDLSSPGSGVQIISSSSHKKPTPVIKGPQKSEDPKGKSVPFFGLSENQSEVPIVRAGKKSLEGNIETVSTSPKVLKVDQGKKGPIIKAQEIEADGEFEIKTIKQKNELLGAKSPDFDIEASIEDSGQLENPYLAGIANRNSESKNNLSGKPDSRPGSSKGTIRGEPSSLQNTQQSKLSVDTTNYAKSVNPIDTGLKRDESLRNVTSPRPSEPLSPGQVSSSTFFGDNVPKLLAENKVLSILPAQTRKLMVEELVNITKESLARTGKKIIKLEEALTMQRLEKLYENYSMNKSKFKYKNNEELIGFVLSIARTVPEPFLPLELVRSKMPFTEMMIKEKMNQYYVAIFVQIKDLLVESIIQGWIEENLALGMFTDTMLNFMTSKSQFKRCQQNLSKIIRAGLSRPPTAIKDTSFETTGRVVTPGYGQKFTSVKAQGSGYQSIHSEIDKFQEVIDD